MASGGPMMNGDISRSPNQSGTLEETLQQMNILIQENRDLKGESRCVVRRTGLESLTRFIEAAAFKDSPSPPEHSFQDWLYSLGSKVSASCVPDISCEGGVSELCWDRWRMAVDPKGRIATERFKNQMT